MDADCKAELHIVGGTDYQDYYDSLKKLAKELKVSDYVTFHGFQTDVSKFYQNASINLLTSVSEGFGMTLIEAMANGVPSVVYDLPNIDIVQKRKGIKVVPQGDVRGAAREIIALLSDDHALQAEGQAARQSVLEAYALSVPEFWKSVFTEVGSGETSELNAPDYAKIRNAVTIMVDNYLEGVEKRSCIFSNTGGFQAGDIKMPLIEKWTDRFPDDVDPYDVTLFPGDRVLALCQRELIGIKYLVRFFFTWINCIFRN